MQSSSSDYASISSAPGHELLIQEPPPGSLQQIVASLRSRLVHGLKQLNRQRKIEEESETPPPLPPKPFQDQECGEDGNLYVNTGHSKDPTVTLTQVQTKLKDLLGTIETPKRPDSLKITNLRPRAQTCTPLIMPKGKTGSHAVRNVDDIWQYQLDHRYAPLSIMQRSPSPVKLRKGLSFQSRKSYLRNRRMHMQQQNANHLHVNQRVSDYEVPLSLPGVSGSLSKIPPPAQVRERSKSQPLLQDAFVTHDQDDYDSLSPQPNRTRPDSEDYDYVVIDKEGRYHDVKENDPFRPTILLSASSVPCLPASLAHERHETNSLPMSPFMTPLERAIADLESESRQGNEVHNPEATTEVISDFENSL